VRAAGEGVIIMRKALAIELVDVRSLMAVKGYEGEPFLFTQPLFVAHGCDIIDLGIALGLDIPRDGIVETYHSSDGKTRHTSTRDIELRVHPGENDLLKCAVLEAEPQGAGLLTFRVGWEDEAGGVVFSEYTYSGVYVVTWAASHEDA